MFDWLRKLQDRGAVDFTDIAKHTAVVGEGETPPKVSRYYDTPEPRRGAFNHDTATFSGTTISHTPYGQYTDENLADMVAKIRRRKRLRRG